jgi:uncharacterized membrane protein YsdA (DUF1294 family)
VNVTAIIGIYAVFSTVSFVLYGVDKLAAEKGWRRTPENTLHLLALLGGWPGCLAGQRIFRHKSRKQPFQTLFLCTVLINCLGLAFLLLHLSL